VLAAAFITSGIIHMVKPDVFQTGMPRLIPEQHHKNLIYISGLAELACAYGLLKRTTWGAHASVAVLVGVFPANVQMALDAGTGRNPSIADKPAAAWARLPLQIPMVWAALQAKPEH
jgi:uncharacterized membrane protein